MALVEGRYFKGAMTDKRHEADGLAMYTRRFLSSGVWELGDNLRVSAAGGMAVVVGYGYALVAGYPFGVLDNGTGPLVLPAEDAHETLPRIDRVVVRPDAQARRVYPYIKAGTPSASPSAPALDVGEISLAALPVAAGTTEITSITDERADDTACGLVHISSAIVAQIKLAMWPVGSVYANALDPTSPAALFGGIWSRIKDRFPLAAGDTYPAGSTGGHPDTQQHTHVQNAHYHNQARINFFAVATDNPLVAGYTTAQFPWNDTPTSSTVATNQTYGTGDSGNMPPYLGMYMWIRTA